MATTQRTTETTTQPAQCAQFVWSRERFSTRSRCARAAVDGEYCKQHSQATVNAKAERAALEKRMRDGLLEAAKAKQACRDRAIETLMLCDPATLPAPLAEVRERLDRRAGELEAAREA